LKKIENQNKKFLLPRVLFEEKYFAALPRFMKIFPATKLKINFMIDSHFHRMSSADFSLIIFLFRLKVNKIAEARDAFLQDIFCYVDL
jgi:hypothetical protein